MADLLATPGDLRALLKEDSTTLPDDEANVLLGLATGAVQAAIGQDLLEAVGDVVTLLGTTESWFDLPQRPVTAVTTVVLDGTTITDYKRFGARLWRSNGWATIPGEPSTVVVTYSHGYADWDAKLGLARSAVLTLAARTFANPIGATGLSIDDYSQQFSQSSNSDLSGLVPATLRRALRRAYGPRGRAVGIG